MKIEVLTEKNNPLLDRKELVVAVADYDATPKRDELAGEVAKKSGCEKECVYVEKLAQGFGAKKARAFVHVYSSAAAHAKRVHKKAMRTSGKKKTAPAA